METINQTEIKSSFYKDFVAITKARLAISVVFSTIAGYLLGIDSWSSNNWFILLLLAIGGYCMVGASNVFNQIIEKDLDALMDRTKNRPLPSERMTKQTAFIFGSVLTILGLIILYNVNPKTAMFSAISIFMYVSLYTPLKTITPLSVFVGAFPGAIPFMLGWVAATGHFGIEAGTLFIIQFFWQFPHFWAIAWVSDEDYKRAGFKLLPSGGGQDLNTAIQIMIYTLFLLPLGLLPSYFGLVGLNSGIVATVCGVLFLAQTFSLMRDCSRKSALKIMFGSFIYLPVVQIAYLLDKMP